MTNEKFEVDLRSDIENWGDDTVISISFKNNYMFLIYHDFEDDGIYCVTYDISSNQRKQINRISLIQYINCIGKTAKEILKLKLSKHFKWLIDEAINLILKEYPHARLMRIK